jgi:Arc/MetJ-type ribon-helix-helix transcriptional regulator
MAVRVTLSEEVARFVEARVQAGDSPDVDSCVNDLLRRAAEQGASYEAWFRREVATAVREADAGDFASDEEVRRTLDRRP